MKTSRIRKVVAGFALALAALVAVPAAAMAVDAYPPTPNPSPSTPLPTVIGPGGSVRMTFGPGAFGPNEQLIFSLIGEGVGPANLATFFTVASTATKNKVAAGDGSLSAGVTLPTNASGRYDAALTDQSGNVRWSQSFTVAGAGAGGAGTGLATTGAAGDQLLWAWVAGGALAFVGGGVLVASAVRKQRKLAE